MDVTQHHPKRHFILGDKQLPKTQNGKWQKQKEESESGFLLMVTEFSSGETFKFNLRDFESGHLQHDLMLRYNPFNSHLRGSLPGSSPPAVIFSVMAGGRDEMAVVPLSTGAPSAHKGAPLEKILDISAHIPPLLLSETWMIWLFDDSLFRKSVSAPYVSNMRRARYLDALPWALWKASAVLQPGGRIDLWTQTCIPHGAKAHWTGLKCTFKETLSQSFASCVLSLIVIILFYFSLWINNTA